MKKEELEFAIGAAASIFGDGVMGYVVRGHALRAAHDVDEQAPLSIVNREPGAEEKVVLLNALAIKTAAIEHGAEIGAAGEGEILEGGIPSAEGVTVGRDDVDGIAVGCTNVNISTREQLSSGGGCEQHETQKCQHYGSGFRHENDSSPAIYASSKFYLNV